MPGFFVNDTQWCGVRIQSVSSTLAIATSTALCSVANLAPSGPSINPHYHFPPSLSGLHADHILKALFTHQQGGKMCAFVCVCICACCESVQRRHPMSVLLFILVWIFFQPTDTCQRYTQHILMFLLYFLFHLSPLLLRCGVYLRSRLNKHKNTLQEITSYLCVSHSHIVGYSCKFSGCVFKDLPAFIHSQKQAHTN